MGMPPKSWPPPPPEFPPVLPPPGTKGSDRSMTPSIGNRFPNRFRNPNASTHIPNKGLPLRIRKKPNAKTSVARSFAGAKTYRDALAGPTTIGAPKREDVAHADQILLEEQDIPASRHAPGAHDETGLPIRHEALDVKFCFGAHRQRAAVVAASPPA